MRCVPSSRLHNLSDTEEGLVGVEGPTKPEDPEPGSKRSLRRSALRRPEGHLVPGPFASVGPGELFSHELYAGGQSPPAYMFGRWAPTRNDGPQATDRSCVMSGRTGRQMFGKRWRTGFALVALLGVMILGGLLALGIGPYGETSMGTMNGVESPTVAEAPEVVDKPEVQEKATKVTEKAAEPGKKAAQTKEKIAEEDKAETAEAPQKKAGAAQREPVRRASAEEEVLPPAPADPTMSLTIPKMGLYDNTVLNTQTDQALDQGAIKLPSTGFPWQDNANPYITAHRVGYAGTESYYQFYDLPALQPGDDIYLTDANGTTYSYHVTDIFAVDPTETWVTYPIPGEDMLTLQTCIESANDWWTLGPAMMGSWASLDRLVVRAERVAVYPA